ncbi:Dyggve-Melchior-Clausen syndrome protein-domain-containing protein [Kickxella alabastrina]|uniref:Dyggve-Melchior-Clausen syndrome protein-domain-containing protein n=1 Tax=Kickxella alabastrina TaxID=61397 RepID=UPI00221EC6E5|nr:Dyggve-Melchior-Clausen syndrome protein-domain-containing protein [Kickxella alabastrina]KAI7829257.1 Dyggve-Melchior-Clausen syndrome protein-domain-containing protein [Kickxella alabastrina]
MFHFVAHMRCLKTVDFLGDIDPALASLQFILRIMLKGLCLTLDDGKLRKVLADRQIVPGTIDLIVDKHMALENGEVRTHAFKQTLADPNKLYQQLLRYVVLAIARVDISRSQSQYVFYQDLVGMLLDVFASQLAASSIPTANNLFVCELLSVVGPSTVFNIGSTQADEIVCALLLNAIEAPTAPSTQGLVQSAYSYLFSRQYTAHSKQTEQYSLFLLMLLISAPPSNDGSRNPYLQTLESLANTSESVLKIDRCAVPFQKLFAKIVAELHSIEWTALFQTLVARNEAFRTYALARTDADTLIVPLLKRISAATALPFSSSFAHGHGSTVPGSVSGAGSGKRRGDKHVAAPSFVTVVSEVTHHQKQQQQSQQFSGAWTMPSTSPPLGPPTTAPTVGSATTLGMVLPASTATSNTISSNNGSSGVPLNSPGIRLRQSAMLPYSLVPETVPYVHLYLWLDILLVLSSDAQFVEQLQRTMIDFWPATPHPLHKPPLSHCLVVESMRIFQLNLMLLKDSQVHKLSLGILVNVLSRSTAIPSAIAQKLIKLFEMIHKRYSKLAVLHPDNSNHGGEPTENLDEQGVYAQTLSTLLALFCHLLNTNNPQFIYGVLQAREILSAFAEPTKASYFANADGLIGRAMRVAAELRVRVAYFHARIAALPSPQQAKDILALVESVVANDHGDSETQVDLLSRVPDDSEWSAFMLPLVWELLLTSTVASVAEGKTPLLEEFENLVM